MRDWILNLRSQWLRPWLPLLRQRCQGLPVLELGCGTGVDTAWLAAAGFAVSAIDASAGAIATARARVPAAQFQCRDLRSELPLQKTGVVVASLSLHYFDWEQTEAAVAAIRRVLVPGGVLLCRLNSTRDVWFGARGHPQISRNFYSVAGQSKRFFDRPDIEKLFQGWHIRHIAEKRTLRFKLPKTVWEVVLEASPAMATAASWPAGGQEMAV